MKYLFRILLLVFPTIVLAQRDENSRIDSMLNALKAAAIDTNKALLLDEISFHYYTINPNEGLKYAGAELDLAQKLNWKKGIALAYNSFGDNYLTESNYPAALEYYFKAVTINEAMGYKLNLARNLNHIGVVYKQQKDFSVALDYYLKALKINEAQGNKSGIALNIGNIGNIYCFQRKYPEALDCHLKSLKIYEELRDKDGIAHILGNIGLVYKTQGNYPKALEYYFKALELDREEGQKNEIQIKEGNIGDCYLQLAKETATSKTENLGNAINYLQKSIDLSKELGNLTDLQTYLKFLSDALALAGNDKEALELYLQYNLLKDSVFSKENNDKIAQINYERKRMADSLTTAQGKRLTELRLRHQKHYTYLGILAIIILVFFSFFIVKERAKSEKLLLNILPEEAAAELKANGAVKARHFENVTVLFARFVNQPQPNSPISPEQLVNELNTCFKVFDKITSKYNIEKIKTVGDAYLAVAGLPLQDLKHAENMTMAAIELRKYMSERPVQPGIDNLELRIGIHSGSVVAGVVGVKKFAYDIWGDTVNTAARMEQNSQPGKINISQTAYQLVKDKFEFSYRGNLEVKNKGMMKMYFVEHSAL